MFSLLALPPIFRALVALALAGASFPLAGVMVVRQNLLQLRYALMHGLLLGGALSLALRLPALPMYLAMCILTVALVLALGRGNRLDLGLSSAFLMVISVALAAIITQAADVPSRDTLDLLWGSPFTLRWSELAVFALLALAIVVYCVAGFKAILLVFFDRDVALSGGKRVRLHESVMVFLIAFAVALSMRFVGALLIDALLILPVVISMKRARSVKSLFIHSSLIGLATSLIGFFLSLAFDMPASSMIAISSAAIYLVLPKRRK